MSTLESVMEFALQFILKFVLLKKTWKKHYSLLEFVSGPPPRGRPNANSGRPFHLVHNPPCRTPCTLFFHEVFFGPLGLHLRVWSELGQSPPFRPMRSLRLQWSWAFSLVCEVALIHHGCLNTRSCRYLHSSTKYVDSLHLNQNELNGMKMVHFPVITLSTNSTTNSWCCWMCGLKMVGIQIVRISGSILLLIFVSRNKCKSTTVYLVRSQTTIWCVSQYTSNLCLH